jgi:hypothetical protein
MHAVLFSHRTATHDSACTIHLGSCVKWPRPSAWKNRMQFSQPSSMQSTGPRVLVPRTPPPPSSVVRRMRNTDNGAPFFAWLNSGERLSKYLGAEPVSYEPAPLPPRAPTRSPPRSIPPPAPVEARAPVLPVLPSLPPPVYPTPAATLARTSRPSVFFGPHAGSPALLRTSQSDSPSTELGAAPTRADAAALATPPPPPSFSSPSVAAPPSTASSGFTAASSAVPSAASSRPLTAVAAAAPTSAAPTRDWLSAHAARQREAASAHAAAAPATGASGAAVSSTLPTSSAVSSTLPTSSSAAAAASSGAKRLAGGKRRLENLEVRSR